MPKKAKINILIFQDMNREISECFVFIPAFFWKWKTFDVWCFDRRKSFEKREKMYDKLLKVFEMIKFDSKTIHTVFVNWKLMILRLYYIRNKSKNSKTNRFIFSHNSFWYLQNYFFKCLLNLIFKSKNELKFRLPFLQDLCFQS
jgi:hypothetical protein